MGPGRGAERQPNLGPLQQTWRQPIRAADDKASAGTAVSPPLPDQSRERRAIEAVTTLIEYGDDSAVGNDVGECN